MLRKYIFFIFSLLLISACGPAENTTGEDADARPKILDFIDIHNVPVYDLQNRPWDDDASGPDLMVELYRGEEPDPVYVSSITHNIQPGKLPVHWPIVQQRIPVANQDWTLVLYDVDEADKEEMQRWEFSPGIDDEETILTEGENYRVEIGYKSAP